MSTTQANPMPSPPSGLWRTISVGAGGGKLPKGLDAAFDAAVGRVGSLVPRRRRFLERADRILGLEKQYADLTDVKLRDTAADLRAVFRLGREEDEHVDQAMALVREASLRALGYRHHLVQIAAGLALLDGCFTEMATGEGKTLMATTAATIAGWRGKGCHVVTVNDYLAKRDAEHMGRVYRLCGLSCAAVEGQTPPPLRRAAYEADITYLTNKEVAADFLRDKLAMGRLRGLPPALLAKIADRDSPASYGPDRLVQRGLPFAIVDEADSVLIDESVTPLIISGEAPNTQQVEAYQQASQLADTLVADEDYKVDLRYREVRLTPAGRAKVAEASATWGGLWAGARRREELVNQAVTARVMFLRDKQYVVQEDKIVIVDEFTGRLMPDRTWRDGLHSAVEAKEGLPVNPPKDTYARISFQRFFRMYRHLSGMTGTAAEARHEMWQIYHRPVVLIPTHKPCIRTQAPDRLYRQAPDKWKAIAGEIAAMHAAGRPVLVGTRSVAASEYLSGVLKGMGLEHQVLNAVRHAEEAQIVAGAGQPGRITVATNMAGRGTDIKLGRGVAELGGLHVVATEAHESHRVDRQLFGRAGRQGDPGSAALFAALDDELFLRHLPAWARRLPMSADQAGQLSGPMSRRLIPAAQNRAERMALRQRKSVLRTDDWLDESLGFAARES